MFVILATCGTAQVRLSQQAQLLLLLSSEYTPRAADAEPIFTASLAAQINALRQLMHTAKHSALCNRLPSFSAAAAVPSAASNVRAKQDISVAAGRCNSSQS
jgi:hypothetical protein